MLPLPFKGLYEIFGSATGQSLFHGGNQELVNQLGGSAASGKKTFHRPFGRIDPGYTFPFRVNYFKVIFNITLILPIAAKIMRIQMVAAHILVVICHFLFAGRPARAVLPLAHKRQPLQRVFITRPIFVHIFVRVHTFFAMKQGHGSKGVSSGPIADKPFNRQMSGTILQSKGVFGFTFPQQGMGQNCLQNRLNQYGFASSIFQQDYPVIAIKLKNHIIITFSPIFKD